MKKVVAVMLMGMGLSGCMSLYKSMGAYSDYEDPDRAMLLVYVKFDKNTYGSIMQLRAQEGGDAPRLGVVGEDASGCTLIGGPVKPGAYELALLSHSQGNQTWAYEFEKGAASTPRFTAKNAGLVFGGAYAMTLEDAGGLFRNGKFGFSRTTACPGEQQAYRQLRKAMSEDDIYKVVFAGTVWPERVNKRLGASR